MAKTQTVAQQTETGQPAETIPPPAVAVETPVERAIPRPVWYRNRDGKTYRGKLIRLHVNRIQVGEGDGARSEDRPVAEIEVDFGGPPSRPKRATVDGIPAGPLASPRAVWWTEI